NNIALSTTTQSFNGLTFAQSVTVPNSGDVLFTPTVSGTLNLSGLSSQAANTVLVNSTGANGAVTAEATSTFANTLFGVGTNGQVLAWNGGLPAWVASTTFSAGSGISLSLAGNTWTVSNTGVLGLVDPFTHSTNFGQAVAATTTTLFAQSGIQASSTS